MNEGIIPDLLMIAQTHFRLSDLEVANLKLFVEECISDDPQKLIPLHRISSQQVFFEVIENIIDRLKILINSQEWDEIKLENDKGFTGFAIPLPNDPIESLLRVAELKDFLPDDSFKKLRFHIWPDGEADVLVPAELLVALPTRDVNMGSNVARLFGKPIGTILKERGVVEQKRRSNTELERDYFGLIFSQVVPMMEKALKSGKITQEEYKFTTDFINTINFYRNMFIGCNKEVIKKDIISTMSITNMVTKSEINSTVYNLAKSGMVPPDQISNFEQALLACPPAKCKSCGNSFNRTRKTQTFCEKCSNSAAYHRERRSSKGLKPRGGKRPGAGRPKKS